MEADGSTSHTQHRVQASGRAEVSCRRDAPQPRQGHDLSRNLIRSWIQKFEAGAFDVEATTADTIQTYEARIGALERLVGRRALEIEFLKGALKHGPRPRDDTSRTSKPASARRHAIGRW